MTRSVRPTTVGRSVIVSAQGEIFYVHAFITALEAHQTADTEYASQVTD